MPETDKFQVFMYKIYVLAVRMKGIAIIYQIQFCQHQYRKSRYGPQKPQKLKVLKTIDFKHFLENKSSRKLPQNSVFIMKQKFTNLYSLMSTLQPALMHNQH